MQTMSDYYSAIQLRFDRWSALRSTAEALARDPAGRAAAKRTKEIAELFESLAPIEAYWAFPGLSAFDYLRRQFEHGHYGDLAFSVRRVTRALTSGAYRRRSIPLAREEVDTEDLEDEATLTPEARALSPSRISRC